jgi:DNA helicase II / ATP-dependent DNA helicase PcrA
MNLSNEEMIKEEQYLQETTNIIQKHIDDSSTKIDLEKMKIGELKKYVWTSQNEMDAIEMRARKEAADLDVSIANIAINRTFKLFQSLEKPYFGRVDFKDKDDETKIYIGLTNVDKKNNIFVYDWRTPIASLFYNYEVGEAKYDTIEGEMHGIIKRKRQYKIEKGKLKYCFDNDLNIQDEYLQEILSQTSNDRMKNIVNSIQKEQNEIIRNQSDKILLVQGSAGSGKTSVALHRIAYLLYALKNLTNNNVLIFSPNEVFSEYISNVLPELGENNVLQTTFSDFSYSYMKGIRKIENFTDFLERSYNKSLNKIDKKLIKIKLSDSFKDLMDKEIKKVKTDLSFSKDLVIDHEAINQIGFGEFVYSKEDMNDLINDKYKKLPILERIDYLSEYICDNIGISYRKYKPSIRKRIKECITIPLSFKEIYINILKSEEFELKYGFKSNFTLKNGNLNYEDLLPLLYIKFELEGYPPNFNIQQVVVDEGQDYSKLQYHILSKIFEKSSFTILGDTNQTINPYYKYNNFDELSSLFKSKSRYLELNKTYRSTKEIIDFTNSILNINNACAVRKENSKEVIEKEVLYENLDATLLYDINKMKSEGMKRIAIITKDQDEAKEIYKLIKNNLDEVSLIDKLNRGVHSKIIVLPSYISKGLEFDGVIVYTKEDNHYKESEKNLYYVACTRAQHYLMIYNQKKIA